jgi:hypothetical protein
VFLNIVFKGAAISGHLGFGSVHGVVVLTGSISVEVTVGRNFESIHVVLVSKLRLAAGSLRSIYIHIYTLRFF